MLLVWSEAALGFLIVREPLLLAESVCLRLGKSRHFGEARCCLEPVVVLLLRDVERIAISVFRIYFLAVVDVALVTCLELGQMGARGRDFWFKTKKAHRIVRWWGQAVGPRTIRTLTGKISGLKHFTTLFGELGLRAVAVPGLDILLTF